MHKSEFLALFVETYILFLHSNFYKKLLIIILCCLLIVVKLFYLTTNVLNSLKCIKDNLFIYKEE